MMQYHTGSTRMFRHTDVSANHLLGPMPPRAYPTFEASRVACFSGMMRGRLEVRRSLKTPFGLVKSFFLYASSPDIAPDIAGSRRCGQAREGGGKVNGCDRSS